MSRYHGQLAEFVIWGNSESLWQSELQNYESLLANLRITFQMVSQKDLKFPLF